MPAPSSSNAAIRPRTRTCPSVGRRIPAMHLNRVDLPQPFAPMSPKVVPSSISRSTPRNAQKSS